MPRYRVAHAAPTQLPEPSSVCCAIVLTAMEALHGITPTSRLSRWVTPEILRAFHRRAMICTQAIPPGTPPPLIRILRNRIVRFGDTVVEGTVIVHDGTRVRAAAIRLESSRYLWRATALEIG